MLFRSVTNGYITIRTAHGGKYNITSKSSGSGSSGGSSTTETKDASLTAKVDANGQGIAAATKEIINSLIGVRKIYEKSCVA